MDELTHIGRFGPSCHPFFTNIAHQAINPDIGRSKALDLFKNILQNFVDIGLKLSPFPLLVHGSTGNNLSGVDFEKIRLETRILVHKVRHLNIELRVTSWQIGHKVITNLDTDILQQTRGRGDRLEGVAAFDASKDGFVKGLDAYLDLGNAKFPKEANFFCIDPVWACFDTHAHNAASGGFVDDLGLL